MKQNICPCINCITFPICKSTRIIVDHNRQILYLQGLFHCKIFLDYIKQDFNNELYFNLLELANKVFKINNVRDYYIFTS